MFFLLLHVGFGIIRATNRIQGIRKTKSPMSEEDRKLFSEANCGGWVGERQDRGQGPLPL